MTVPLLGSNHSLLLAVVFLTTLFPNNLFIWLVLDLSILDRIYVLSLNIIGEDIALLLHALQFPLFIFSPLTLFLQHCWWKKISQCTISITLYLNVPGIGKFLGASDLGLNVS